MHRLFDLAIGVVFTFSALLSAKESASDKPKPIPATRPEIKKVLEALKEREPRLPLPEPVADEVNVNNARMRAQYLPEAWIAGGSRTRPRGQTQNRGFRTPWIDPNAKLDYPLLRSCFWVVSRGNNCHYCLGHQELALRGAGYSDDKVAAIDCDWSQFEPRQQAALAFARKLTIEPQLVGDADIAKLKELYSDPEIIELTYNICRFNATNRWTDGTGIAQDRRLGEEENSFLTPTGEKFQNTESIVAPTTRAARPPLPTLDEVKQALADCSQRKPRVELPSEEDAAKELAKVLNGRAPVIWERAIAQLPEVGATQVVAYNTIMTDENLPLRLKAEIALISAVNNHAWYAVGMASDRLRQQGVSTEEMVAVFDNSAKRTAGEAAAYRLALKSTVDPHLVSDADIAQVREHYSDAETAEILQVICMANMFDRFTEALGLPLEY